MLVLFCKMSRNSLKQEPQQVSNRETEIILEFARTQLAQEGDWVEFGCYRGDTSLLLEKILEEDYIVGAADIANATHDIDKHRKQLWIYDSFAGLPEKHAFDNSVAGDAFQAGELFVTKREVVERFRRAGLRLPVIKKGFFENLDPTEDLPDKIGFAFLDGDLYQSIKTSLELVKPRLTDGGIILVHDYNNPELPGAARAVDEWMAKNPQKQLVKRETIAIIK